MKTSSVSWCAGFFEAEGSASFAAKCPTLTVVNTNPLAVATFLSCMLENGIEFSISERSKPSKSSKKKRWDLYLQNKDCILYFIDLMDNYIVGKKRQLQLIKEFYSDDCLSYNKKYEVYNNRMKFINQTNNIIILDKDILKNKLDNLIYDKYETRDNDNIKIPLSDINDLDYLAGIVDGEGTFYMGKRKNRHRKNYRFTPNISLTNTNKKIISKCCSILKYYNIGYHIQTRENRNRVRWDVSVSGIKRNKILSELLSNRLVIKDRQNKLINQYCILRLKDIKGLNKIGDSYKEAIEALNKEN